MVTELVGSRPQPAKSLITAVAWAPTNTSLAVGSKSGLIRPWDVETNRVVRDLRAHTRQVQALSFNGFMLSSGSRDTFLKHWDVRMPLPVTSHACKSAVCGVKWSPDGVQVAVGLNQNEHIVWDRRNLTKPLWQHKHKAAVKALAWNWHQRGVLVTGGGTADRRIRVWDSLLGRDLAEVDTGSQVRQRILQMRFAAHAAPAGRSASCCSAEKRSNSFLPMALRKTLPVQRC